MIFSKRGFGAEELLKMLVALVILCLVVLGFYRLMTGHWPVNYIPGFNQTGEGKTELAMVRYVITEDRVDYYDGANWRAFGDAERELSGRTYGGVALKEILKEGYFDSKKVRRTSETVEFFDSYYARIRAMQPYDSAGYVRGDVILELRKHGTDGGLGQLQEEYAVRGLAGDVVMIGSTDPFLKNNVVAREQVRRKALAWRERVLELPVRLTYRDETGEHQLFVCMKRTQGSEDLVSDLSISVDADTRCGSAL